MGQPPAASSASQLTEASMWPGFGLHPCSTSPPAQFRPFASLHVLLPRAVCTKLSACNSISESFLENPSQDILFKRWRQFDPSSLPPLCPQSILYVCISIPALQRGSSVPFSRFHIYTWICDICFCLCDLLPSVWQRVALTHTHDRV